MLKPYLFLIVLLILLLPVLLLLLLSVDAHIAALRVHLVFATFKGRLAQQATPETVTGLVLCFTADPFATLITVKGGDSQDTHDGWISGKHIAN